MSTNPPLRRHRISRSSLGYVIHHYDRLSSTNDAAKRIARKGGEEKIVIVSETQTRGKGRLGRRWASPKGGIWLSILLRPKISPKETTKLTFIAATSVAKTIQDTLGLEMEIKWPNDVLIRGRKVCGILVETATRGDTTDFVIVGVGINANIDRAAFPRSLQDSATSLKIELGHRIDRGAFFKSFLHNFEQRYRRFQHGLWDVLLQEWKSLAKFLGKRVEVESFEEVLVGEALDVDEAGALIIRSDDEMLRKIVAGDVRLKIPSV
jgi:BirA family biotin operon repressor/biotin-[acetyl-CoA-carboxylase] ligase